jgi:hypothetical protein
MVWGFTILLPNNEALHPQHSTSGSQQPSWLWPIMHAVLKHVPNLSHRSLVVTLLCTTKLLPLLPEGPERSKMYYALLGLVQQLYSSPSPTFRPWTCRSDSNLRTATSGLDSNRHVDLHDSSAIFPGDLVAVLTVMVRVRLKPDRNWMAHVMSWVSMFLQLEILTMLVC